MSKSNEYPMCPVCGRAVVGALMATNAIKVDGKTYYPADAASVYCSSGECTYDAPLSSIPFPPPPTPSVQ